MKILISFRELPSEIYGAAVQDSTDPRLFRIFCNSTNSTQRRRHAYGHELAHVLLGHFETADPLTYLPKEKAFLQRGTILQESNYNPNTNSEKEAEEKAWYYYRRFRDQFLLAETTGGAVIEIPEGSVL